MLKDVIIRVLIVFTQDHSDSITNSTQQQKNTVGQESFGINEFIFLHPLNVFLLIEGEKIAINVFV